MSSKSSTKKKLAVTDTPKVKLPSHYIVRPLLASSPKNIAKVYINSTLYSEFSTTFISISKDGAFPTIALLFPDDSVPDNIILISSPLRTLSGLLLGDRIQLSPYLLQPSYTTDLTYHVQKKESSTPEEEMNEKKLISTLDDIGLISPGLSFEVDDVVVTIIDINSDVSLSLASLSLADSTSSSSIPTFLFRRNTTLNFDSLLSRPSTSKYPHLPKPTTYNQIGGLSKTIKLLKSTIELPLLNPQLFSDFGINPPRGILLHGPPGTGKTMLLRSVANESNAHILNINGPSLVSKYLGETENALRDVFIEARKFQPSIIFIDEIDSIVPNRNSDDSGETESRVVATLLTMMDGMGESGQIVVVGATNRPNSIDPALRRPGRFDQEVEIGIPDVEARYDILLKSFEKMTKSKCDLTLQDIQLISSKTHGYVGADLSALCRESVMKAITRGLSSGIVQSELKLKVEDLLEALPEIRPSAMREIFLEMPKVYWSDIGGQEDLKRKLTEVVQLPLEAADTFKKLGVSAPKGVLLYGPPGCSKTLTAKALATESGLNFLAVKGPEILNKYVGESERTIREIFRKARAASPSIIFFDEIDAISGDRDNSSSSSNSQNVLTSLLNEIDGVEELKGVVIVAATNRPTEIDPALLRPGRLDRHIYVSPPDFDARMQILSKSCEKFNTTVDFKNLSNLTDGCSGAEVVLLCQEAGLAAVMEDKQASKVEQRHFDHALSTISKGITEDMLDYYKEFAKRSGLNN